MGKAACSDEEFIQLWKAHGAAETSRRIGTTEKNVFARRRRIEERLGILLDAPGSAVSKHPGRINLDVENGVVLVGSDAHIWPGQPLSTAFRAFIKFCSELKPRAVILNGDVMDFPRISRHDPLGWEKQPEVKDEIEAAQDALQKVEAAAGRAHKIWGLGNHDARFESRLANAAPEFHGVRGSRLKDHFPLWEGCWSVWINGNVAVKHRWPKGGGHATTNNPLWAGMTTVQGHLHSAQVRPLTDLRGTRYGVDTGCLAEPWGDQFEYMEDGYRNWRSAFGVFTFHKGRLLHPELVLVHEEGSVEWRGTVLKV